MNPWRGLEGLPREVWILSAATLVNRAGTMALPFLVLYLTRSLGFSAERAGLVLFCYGVGSLVTGPVAGRLSDSMGPERIMKLSLFVSGALLLAFPLLGDYGTILVMTLLWSITSEAFRPACFTALAHAVPSGQRKAAIVLARLAVNLGMSVGPVVGGFLAVVSYPALFLLDGATSILAGLILTLSLPAKGAPPAHAASGDAADQDPRGTSHATSMRDLVFFLIALLPVMMVFFQIQGAFPLFLVHDLGLPESAFGLLLAVNTILIILLEVPLNLWIGHWPHARALAMGALLTGAGFGALALSRGAWSVAATVVVWTFGEMILLPAATAHVADLAPPHCRGAYMGLQQMTFALALSLGSWIGTVTLARFGGAALWSAAFACGVLSAGLMGILRQPRP